MPFRPENQRQGFTQVYFRNGGNEHIARNEFEPICEALKRGDEWYDAVDLFGDPELIRLSNVAMVALASATGIVAFDRQEDEKEAHRKTHGDG